jgi:hypothetical protein
MTCAERVPSGLTMGMRWTQVQECDASCIDRNASNRAKQKLQSALSFISTQPPTCPIRGNAASRSRSDFAAPSELQVKALEAMASCYWRRRPAMSSRRVCLLQFGCAHRNGGVEDCSRALKANTAPSIVLANVQMARIRPCHPLPQ